MRSLGICQLPPLFSEGLDQGSSSLLSSSFSMEKRGFWFPYNYNQFNNFTGGMDIDLSLPSSREHNKEEDEKTGIENMFNGQIKLHNGDLGSGNATLGSGNATDVGNSIGATDNVIPFAADVGEFEDIMNLEPLPGMEFESHIEGYSFYQEYARSMGFTTAIQNSRRSKTSRVFIDAKFACSRYGTRRKSDNIVIPRRTRPKHDPENGPASRVCAKTNCKASMHVKRRQNGKWIIHSFVKEHNHALSPAQAVNEQTKRMYATMARQYAEYKNVVGKTDTKNSFDNGRKLPLEGGDIKTLLDFFSQMQNLNSNFFYAVDFGEDHRLKNLFWVDAKNRHDYINFCDVVSFDTTYVRNKYKMPLVLFFGVNNHYQLLLLGCALVSAESGETYSWLMQSWLKAMGGHVPKLIITDHDKVLKSVISDVLPDTYHCFFLWHILGKVPETLGHVIKLNSNFMSKFEKCIYGSSTEEEFDKRWWKILDKFQLKDDELLMSLYEDRKRWIPTYLRDTCLAGMSAVQRSESVNSFFDKFVHKKTTVQEFVKLYDSILQDRYDEEAKADSDTWNKQAMIKSPSPFEKTLSTLYTNAVFRKSQVEVLGAVACHPKNEGQDGTNTLFKVQDFEKHRDFVVLCNEMGSEVSCTCRIYQYRGYLCRHALVVLQIQGICAVPSQYILKRWTREAKSRNLSGEDFEQVQSRVQRYNDLCQRAMKLSEEGSVSQESYNTANRALNEAFGNCVSVNTSTKSLVEAVAFPAHGLIGIEDDGGQSGRMSKGAKKRNPPRKRKVNSEQEVMVAVGAQDLQHMEKMTPRPVPIDTYCSPQQNGLLMLNLMDSHRNNYYRSQQTIQGLGQLNSLAPSHGGYYTPQQSMPGMAQMDFLRASAAFTDGMRNDPNVRTSQLHGESSRHG